MPRRPRPSSCAVAPRPMPVASAREVGPRPISSAAHRQSVSICAAHRMGIRCQHRLGSFRYRAR